MIPKKIHYCWFGGNPMPELAKKCIESWKKYCPDYELKLWNEENFDLNSNPYVKEAYEAKKFAFVTDYVRLWALYQYGGIYMDTDVEVLKPLDRFLIHPAFSGFENAEAVPTGIMASEKKLIAPLLKKFSAVTVRETSGIELCAQCGMQHAEITPDPTLLLCADDYRNIMKCPADMKKNEKYLVLYRLRNSDDFDYSTIFSYARKKGISVKYITGNSLCDIRPQCFASIEEWLYLIDHAEYVVTNSFHGAVFAILFQKKFAVIPLTGEKKSMNHRIDSLFKMAEMEPRYLDSFSILDTPWTGNITEVHQRANEVLKKIILSEK